MRHEVLYQYDLPIEVLDDIPRTEEVLEVVYARSKENYLVPILFTRLRILWAYPETSAAYRLYEMNYADLLDVYVKFTIGLPTVMTVTTINGEKNIFNGVKNTAEEMRAALLTLKEIMGERVKSEWKFLHRQNLLMDEYMLKESDDVLDSVPKVSAEDLFEDKMMPGVGCYEPTEKLFDHFPPEAGDIREDEDVFEETAPESIEESKVSKSSALISRITRMVESTEPQKESKEPETPLNDVTVFEENSGISDDQWKDEGKGDAEILPGSKKSRGKNVPVRQAKDQITADTPEEDDSEVYVSEKPKEQQETKAKDAAALISEELDKLPIPVEPKTPLAKPEMEPERPILTTPLPRSITPETIEVGEKTLALSITLEPKDTLNDEDVDKCLEDLKFLREKGVFSEAEYKERCLRLFKRNGL